MKLGIIVEGHGEVSAAPVLVRRIITELIDPNLWVDILKPDRKKRNLLVKEEEFERALEAMARRVGSDGGVLVILDADDDAPCLLGPKLLGWARSKRPDRRHGVVVAQREWEGWYLEAVESLRGKRGLLDDVERPPNPESLRDAKGWFDARMAEGYAETLDQAAFAAELDLSAARRSDSFDKLVRDVAQLLGRTAALRPDPADLQGSE